MEIWKKIDYSEKYEASNTGKIRNKKTGKTLKGFDNGTGYLCVNIHNKTMYIHRLVAYAFIDNPNNYNVVNHIDYNKQNNDISNLEWCTQKMNVNHSRINMMHRKSITHTNTGEKYITKRNNKFRIIVDGKEYPSCKTLEDAIIKRDMILKGEVLQ